MFDLISYVPQHILGILNMNELYQLKGKFHPRTDHEGLEGDLRYSSTVSLTSVLDKVSD